MPTTTAKKLKADDYLREFANQSNEEWLKALVEEILLLRTAPSVTFIDKIYGQFLVKHGLREKKCAETKPSAQSVTPQITDGKSLFSLKNLQHISGVNALECNTSIPFHPMLTVIYGKNGSGKSGFVRILKRVACSKTQEEIWQNIHSKRTQNQCIAKITYAINGNESTYQWNGEIRVAPFVKMTIFDGKCIPIYLNKNSFSYQPYGFELFQFLSISLQNLQERITADIRMNVNRKPSIDNIFNEETLIGKFVADITATTKLDDLNKLPVWNAKTRKLLLSKIKERKELQNLGERSELLHTRLQKIIALENVITRAQSDLSAQNIKTYFLLVNRLNQLKNKQALKKGKTLEDYDIAKKESDEWEKFINAGEKYIHITKQSDYPAENDHCIYCQQKLSKGSQKLIQLYRDLLQEDKISDIEDAESKLSDALINLRNLSFTYDFPYTKNQFETFLPKRLINSAFVALVSIKELARKLDTSLESRKFQKLKPIKTSRIITAVRKELTKLEAGINLIEENRKNLSRKSRELDQEIAELQDIKKFSKYRLQIEKYIAIEKWIEKASSLQANKLSTKSTTDLGKKAWCELVSDLFKNQFKKEAEYLNAPPVNLEFRGEYGSQVRAKNLEGFDGIDQFLSEGEQKAVALADFFTEISIQNEQAPVIFDDPATSFDHDRKEQIAKRIVQESENKQIIVFTHDLMFASFLHDQVKARHDNNNIDPSKALFHSLYSNKSHVGLISENYYPGSTKFDTYIEKISTKAQEIEKLTGEAQADAIKNAYGMLRGAVEKAVEERIFGGVIIRWSEQIQMHNATPKRASLSREKLDLAKQLHEKFSRYIEGHNQSDEMIQHATPDVEQLKSDIQQVKNIATR